MSISLYKGAQQGKATRVVVAQITNIVLGSVLVTMGLLVISGQVSSLHPVQDQIHGPFYIMFGGVSLWAGTTSSVEVASSLNLAMAFILTFGAAVLMNVRNIELSFEQYWRNYGQRPEVFFYVCLGIFFLGIGMIGRAKMKR
jgi:hypothetical protein